MTTRDQFFKDLQQSAVLVERLERGSDLLGYQIAIVLRGPDESITVAHAAVAREEAASVVGAAIVEKTAETFQQEDEEGGDDE